MTPDPPAPAGESGKRRLAERTRERDEARRQFAGAKARLAAATARLEECEAQVARLEEELAQLRGQLDKAADDKQRAVRREQRRQEARLAPMEQELAALRRAEHDRARLEREREQAAADARAREAADRAAELEAQRQRRSGSPDLAAPGRPSVLPPGVVPGTTEHARALLAPGRRILVDGYNVAKTVRGDLAGEAAQRQWLQDACTALAARRGVQIELFFDGASEQHESGVVVGPLVLRFSPAGVDADDDLVFAVEAAEPDEALVVVTDDRELRGRLAPYLVDLLDTRSFSWALRR